MTYTVDPNNASSPTDFDDASFAAAEFRALKAKVNTNAGFYFTAGGTPDAITGTLPMAVDGLRVTANPPGTNTVTNPTLEGDVILKQDNLGAYVALAVGDYSAAYPFSFVYNSTADAGGPAWILNGPAIPNRIKLVGDITLYVATTGLDTNTGLVVGDPWLTPQHAVEVVRDTYDLAGYNITIQCADGTYSVVGNVVNASGAFVGAVGPESVAIVGNLVTPANVVFNAGAASSSCIVAQHKAMLSAYGIKYTGNFAGTVGLYATTGGHIVYGTCTFGTFSGTSIHAYANLGGTLTAAADYTVNGNSGYHLVAGACSIAAVNGRTVTISGAPAFGQNFCQAGSGGYVESVGSNYAGAATGTRYNASLNGVLNTGGGGANYFPGDVAGATATGGQYL